MQKLQLIHSTVQVRWHKNKFKHFTQLYNLSNIVWYISGDWTILSVFITSAQGGIEFMTVSLSVCLLAGLCKFFWLDLQKKTKKETATAV